MKRYEMEWNGMRWDGLGMGMPSGMAWDEPVSRVYGIAYFRGTYILKSLSP